MQQLQKSSRKKKKIVRKNAKNFNADHKNYIHNVTKTHLLHRSYVKKILHPMNNIKKTVRIT